MGWIKNTIHRVTQWSASSGYDAVSSKNRRKQPAGVLLAEDAELDGFSRKKLIASARDLHRNYTVAAWMIRKHLDYTSTFTYQARGTDSEKNKRLESMIRWWSKPLNFDASGRFSLRKMIRLAEQRRTIDGDLGVLKLADGRVQAIEGDRIRTPDGQMPGTYLAKDFTHGIKTDKGGRPLLFCVCTRKDGGGYNFERMVPASNMFHLGYFDRFDQVRGVSPLAPAVNTLRDTYEGFDYALAKMKVAQLMGLTIYRDKADKIGVMTPTIDEDAEETDEETSDEPRYEIDFGRGPVFLDLDPGDRAEFLESKSPSIEFQQFTTTMIGVALKALDIPFSFFSENFTNYSGARQALLQYEQSVATKREDLQIMLDLLTTWRVNLWIQDGYLEEDFADIPGEWVPTGIPWIDPLKEVSADIQAINNGLSSRQRRLRERGEDFFEVADELAAEQKYMTDIGLTLGSQQADAALITATN